MKKIILSILFACILITHATAQVTVSGSNNATVNSTNYSTLGAAITAIGNSQSGQTIEIAIAASTTEDAAGIIIGPGTWASLTIYPTADVTLTSSVTSNALIQFSGANNVTIDGRLGKTGERSLTLNNTGTTSATVNFTNAAQNNTIKYCTITGAGPANKGLIGFGAVGAATNGNGMNTIDHNLITNNGTRSPITVYSVGNVTNPTVGNRFTNNEFKDCLILNGANNQIIGLTGNNSDWVITGNSFYDTGMAAAITGYTATIISITTGTGYTITDNYIGGSDASCVGTWNKTLLNVSFVGINLSSAAGTGSTIRNNTIKNISWTNTGGGTWTGITVGSASAATIDGNYIGDNTTTGSITTSNGAANGVVTGISITSTSAVDCINNKIGSITANSTGFAVAINAINRGTQAANTNISNNTIGSSSVENSIYSSTVIGAESVKGILCTATGTNAISNNEIGSLTTGSTSGVVNAIDLGAGTNTVNANLIYNLSSPNSTSTTLNGINLAASGINTCTNNIISLGNNYANTINGINEAVSTTANNYYYNTIYITGTPTSVALNSIGINSLSTSNNRNIKNNLIFNNRVNGTGATGKNYALSLATYASGILACDYNDLYVTTNAKNFVGKYGGSDKKTLTDWQGISIVTDDNSISITPGFASPDKTAISYKVNTTLSGVDLSSVVPYDYAGVARTTQMGAYNKTISATPTISTSGTLAAVNTTYGTASVAPTSFSVSGANMQAGILVTPPAGYEVSLTEGSGFASTVTVPGTGAISATNVYVRLLATANVASYSGNIVLSSTNATSVNVATASSTVSAKALTITAGNQTVAYGTLAATVTVAGTYTPTGFVNNETSSVISGSATYNTNYTNSTAAATSGITITPVVTGLSAANYSFTPVNGFITIAPADVTVSASNTSVSSLILSPISNVTVEGTGSLTINNDIEVASIAVAAGGKLTINSGRTLAGTVTLESTETSTATLVDQYSAPTLTATVKQHVSAGRNWYLSPSVSAADYSWLSRGTSVQEWNEATKAWVFKTSGTLTPGKGYVQVATSTPEVTGTTGTVNVTGTTNSGDVAITVSRTEAGVSRGFNLVGNPYPSYLKWSGTDGFITDAGNSGISTSFWYRTQNTSNAYVFTTYNGTSHLVVGGSSVNSVLNEYIPPMQAFWIRVDENVGKTTHNVNLTFKNTMRVHGVGDNNKFKAPKADIRQLVRLQLANGVQSDEALIYFDAAAANTFDNYDSPKMLNNSSVLPDIYSTVGTERLAINGLNTVTDNMELSLGFTLKAATIGLKLKVSEFTNFTSGMRVYLLDKELNTQTELFPTTEYTFNTSVSTTNNESRFSLLFRAPASTTGIDNASKTNTQVFVNAANQITIIAPEKSNYAIYNAVGQLIENGQTAAKLQTANCKLNIGVYVVKVNNQSTRVIIK